MELKDVILSTLAEMEEGTQSVSAPVEPKPQPAASNPSQGGAAEPLQRAEMDAEALFLHNVRERLLVLFEGFQSPNNTQIEAKVDLTLNFLEYLLAAIDSRLENMPKDKS